MPIIDLRNGLPELDPDAIDAGLNAIAEETGVPLATVMNLPWAALTPILARLQGRDEADARELATDALAMRNLATLVWTLPAGMTIGQGVAAGLIAEVDAIRATHPSESEVDAELNRGARQRLARGRSGGLP